jgi:CheY-like chemotaxis protein
MMPKMSGYDVARKIREMYPSNSLPIIMVRGRARPAAAAPRRAAPPSGAGAGRGGARPSRADGGAALLCCPTPCAGVAPAVRGPHTCCGRSPAAAAARVRRPRVLGLSPPRRSPCPPPPRRAPKVSAKAEEEDIVEGLKCGADDYVSKPFKRAELAARVRAHIRARDAFAEQQVRRARRARRSLGVRGGGRGGGGRGGGNARGGLWARAAVASCSVETATKRPLQRRRRRALNAESRLYFAP